ncbi:hypothetical protein A2318_01370 [Candidatus Uhrbacteria bacterium RIFOXYB2_FULL_45_11]|uniref:Uncharacterized protein n=1 Tax=Candidatus Uhrbacteria bacterium RIFOXYB2_FULL_45_11 TaxID=1802421 RepID=A0A1F7W601_9BACT|nr:MAG: hypothetical protein A2318_01370 [Candidatus Uhrbacteria bacterium RIFOXYB2_FULL_45_11]
MSTKLEQIESLSEQNSLEAIQALLEILQDETLTEEELEAAEEAFETVSFLHALPQNEEEERDVKLCALIAKRLDYLQDLAFDFYEESENLERCKLESEVAARMLELATEDQKQDREIGVSVAHDMLVMAEESCSTVEAELERTNEWIECAHDMLLTQKYRALPEECFEVLFPSDDEDEDEEEFDCCGEDDCGSEECEGCDDCTGGCNGEGCEGGCEEDIVEDEEEMEEGCCGGGCCK